jgi:putative salt-induced outer membrane protein
MNIRFLLLFLLAANLFAEDVAKKWATTAESGVVLSTGNTEAKTISLKTYAKYEPEKWLHEIKLEKLYSSSTGKNSADIFMALQKSAYKLQASNLIFESLKFNKDKFNGFDYEFNATLGYERKFIDNNTIKLFLAAGPAYYRFVKGVDPVSNKLTAVFNLPFEWNIREGLLFTETLNFLFGDSSVGLNSESISGLKVKLVGNLAMKNTFTLKNKTKVPEGKKGTDTLTEITLVMDF